VDLTLARRFWIARKVNARMDHFLEFNSLISPIERAILP
jgi:hypothetical protein